MVEGEDNRSISPAGLRERLKASRFQPFRIVTSDGTTYDVRDPDLVMVGLAEIVVGIPSDQDAGLFRATHLVSLRHVVRLEPLEGAAAASN
jgi:hypothetical protein